jgi:hypothetical protein
MTVPDLPESTSSAATILPHRQCGRCRRFFAAEAGLDPRLLIEWWACAPCRAALFPARSQPHDDTGG